MTRRFRAPPASRAARRRRRPPLSPRAACAYPSCAFRVHDREKLGLVSQLITLAHEKGVSAFVGEGINRWPAVHRLDAAHLYSLVLEKNAPGACYHAVAEEGVPLKEIAEVIGRRLNIPVVSKSPAEAFDHFGWLGSFMGIDLPVSSAKTQDRLGWRPVQPDLISDLERARNLEN
jgi:nucleoside-diphosphate-sugar epimerase